MAATVRAALYLRVSTGRQAESDLSIPDQRRQAKGYCASRGWEIVADYVEPGASARRPPSRRGCARGKAVSWAEPYLKQHDGLRDEKAITVTGDYGDNARNIREARLVAVRARGRFNGF